MTRFLLALSYTEFSRRWTTGYCDEMSLSLRTYSIVKGMGVKGMGVKGMGVKGMGVKGMGGRRWIYL